MIHSKQRELILDALWQNRTHPTADELFAAVRAADASTISLATVYRNLNQLVDAGIVARVCVPGEADRFDPVNDGHMHMLCTNCGSITDIPKSALPDICSPVSAASGCSVTGYNIIFKGLCQSCKQ